MRCSALPLATKCRGSYKLTEGYGSEQSRLGQAFHEAARAKVLGLAIDKDSLRARFGLTDEEMKSIDYGIYNITIRIPAGAMVLADNKELRVYLGLSEPEKKGLEELLKIRELSSMENEELQLLLKKAMELTGTPDLGIYHNQIVTVADWKSGWGDVEDPETNNQIIGYGILIVEAIKKAEQLEPKRIDLMIIQPKLNQVKAYSFTPEQLRQRAEDIKQIIKEAEEGENDFTTGPWCSSCFKNMGCPAFAGQVRALAAMIVEPVLVGEQGLEVVLSRMLPFIKACNTVGKKVEALAKAFVDRNGPLDLGGGQMYIRKIEDKQEVKPREAFEILRGFFGEDTWSIYSVSMKAMIDLAVKTKRGLSTIIKNSLIESGAIEKKTAIIYRIVKGGDSAR